MRPNKYDSLNSKAILLVLTVRTLPQKKPYRWSTVAYTSSKLETVSIYFGNQIPVPNNLLFKPSKVRTRLCHLETPVSRTYYPSLLLYYFVLLAYA